MPAKKTLLGITAGWLIDRLDKTRLPQLSGEIRLEGLSGMVEIIRDRWGVPHIYAERLQDGLFAQGFVQAQDRLFQMELNRRTARGRLSELFGEIALDTDRTVRTFGFNRLGKTDWENASDELRSNILAYCAGINTFLEQKRVKLPVEFTLLSHRPDPWEPEDTMSFARVMMWQLSHAWQGELVRAEIAERVGAENASELEIHYPVKNPLILPKGIEFNAIDPDGTIRKTPGPFLDRGKGSNSWVVSPERSATGSAVLCNDMHLALSIPCLWYQTHLIFGDEVNVTGVGLPGLPYIEVGHNDRIAWGMTLAFTDAEDLFIEQVDSQNRYLFRDEWKEIDIIDEIIEVKGRPTPHHEKVLVTRHGPIISDVVGQPNQKLAVNSMALRPNQAVEGWRRLNTAKNWDDFVDAMSLIDAPQLKVAYADVENNIGSWTTGKVPIRSEGDGSVPVPGWSGEYEWIGEIPFEEMPYGLNPEVGYLVSCNHKIVADDTPYFLGNVWMNGYRARRLEELIESRDKVSMEDHKAFQLDFMCLPGLEFVERLEGLNDPDPDVQLAIRLLKDWDGHLTPVTVGGTVYEVARYTLIRNLLEPGLGSDLVDRFMGKGFHPLLSNAHEFYGHDTVVLLRLLDNPDSWWIKQGGGRDAILSKSLKQAVEWLRLRLGQDESAWHWGKIHQVNFQHPLSLQKPFDQVFDRGPFPIGGDTDTILQTAINPDDPYDNKAWSPCFRQIVNMGDLGQSFTIIPPGQSGQVSNPHYDDLAQPWLQGEYQQMLWTREQVEGEAEATLVLKPKE